jgi:hypothetical protein
MTPQKQSPGGQARASVGTWRNDFTADVISFPSGHNPTEIVVSAIEQATGKPRRKSGDSWRVCCPSCGGGGYKVSITEGDDARALVTCFSCHDTPAVLGAAGLALRDLYAPRAWPESPAERRRASRAMQVHGWAAALDVLAAEASVILIAGRQLARWRFLGVEDDERLVLAVKRVDGAKATLRAR